MNRFSILVFTDIVGSTDLKVRHGVPIYQAALEIHNRHFENLAAACPGFRILSNLGDGYFAEAGGVVEALRFALLFQDAMRAGPWGEIRLSTRVGIHAGEIGFVESQGGSGIVAPAADLAARVMSLATGGQILLTRLPFDEARHFLQQHPALDGREPPPLRWLAHGPYLIKGLEEPVEIFEAGAEGLAPLAPPPDSEKAKRAVRAGDEDTLGWRPAAGLEIPGRPGWHLTRLLGEGGFGEVWIGEHARLRQRHAFKFCFDQERLRALKREVTLVRLLQSALGERDDIVRLHDLKLDEPPFYLETELAPHGNLLQWAEEQGGIDKVPLATRIALVERTASALAAAHGVGVLHKDIKPTNILVFDGPDGEPRPRLVDFGIGALADPEALGRFGVTSAGFTRATIQHSTGTPTYSPPEYTAGKPYTIQGDIYGLGVLLYQLVTAKPHDPLAPGWERDIADPLLREDIANCVDGDPARRFPSASQLAENLSTLPERHAAAEAAEKELLARQRAAYRKGLMRAAAVAAGIVAVVASLAVTSLLQTKRAQRAERDARHQQHIAETEKARTQQALIAIKYHLERSQLAEGRAWLERAQLAQRENKNLEALLFAGRAVGFRGFGWREEDESGPLATEYPPLLGGRFSDTTTDSQRRSEVGKILSLIHATVPTGLPIWSNSDYLNPVASVAWSPDGSRIASASWRKPIKLWDAATGKELASLEGHSLAVKSVAWSPDGTQLASGADDGLVKVWEAATGKELASLEGHALAVKSVAWSPDGSRIASGSRDMTVKLWDAATGKEVATLAGHSDFVRCVAWSPDGGRIASGAQDNTVKLWDATTGKELAFLVGHSQSVESIAWNPSGPDQIASASLDQTVKVWDTATGKELASLVPGPGGVREIRYFDPRPGSSTPEFGFPDLTAADMMSVAWSPDGSRIAFGSDKKTVEVWDAATWKKLTSFSWPGNVAWSPDGSRIVSGAQDGAVKVWDASIAPKLIAFSKDRNTEDRDTESELSKWDSILGDLPVSWSPDERLIAFGSDDKTVRVRDMATGKELATFAGHSDSVRSVAWSPDGGRIASAASGKTVRVWDTATGKELTAVVSSFPEAGLKAEFVRNVSWSEDGEWIRARSCWMEESFLAADFMWEVATGNEITSSGWYYSPAALSPDGRFTAKAFDGRFVHLESREDLDLFAPIHEGYLRLHQPYINDWQFLGKGIPNDPPKPDLAGDGAIIRRSLNDFEVSQAKVQWNLLPEALRPIHPRQDVLARLAAPDLTPAQRMVLRAQLCAKGYAWRPLPVLWQEAQEAGLDKDEEVRRMLLRHVTIAARTLAVEVPGLRVVRGDTVVNSSPSFPPELWEILATNLRPGDFEDLSLAAPLAQAWPAWRAQPESDTPELRAKVDEAIRRVAPPGWVENVAP